MKTKNSCNGYGNRVCKTYHLPWFGRSKPISSDDNVKGDDSKKILQLAIHSLRKKMQNQPV